MRGRAEGWRAGRHLRPQKLGDLCPSATSLGNSLRGHWKDLQEPSQALGLVQNWGGEQQPSLRGKKFYPDPSPRLLWRKGLKEKGLPCPHRPGEDSAEPHCKRRKEKGAGGATPGERVRFRREPPTTAKEGVEELRGLHPKTQGQHIQKAQPLRTRRQHHPTPSHVRVGKLQVGPSG